MAAPAVLGACVYELIYRSNVAVSKAGKNYDMKIKNQLYRY